VLKLKGQRRMRMRRYLFTPGPVELSKKVKEATKGQMISHRSREFSSLMSGLQLKLRKLLNVQEPVLLFPGSGTSALEALLVNLISRGDKVLSFSCGHFGERFREIASRIGAVVLSFDKPYGEVFTKEEVVGAVNLYSDASAILITHNETSTGAANPIEEIIEGLPADGPLVLVDAVSSIGAMPCYPEKWGVDGLATCSQKGLMAPPGIGIVWLSRRAWEKVRQNKTCPSYSMDFLLMRKYLEKELPQTPVTPPVSLFFALDASLEEVEEEGGFLRRFEERKAYAQSLCKAVEDLGLELLVKNKPSRSCGVTAIRIPGKAESVRKGLLEKGIEVAGGQGALRNEIIRVGHYTREGLSELWDFIQALEETCKELGVAVDKMSFGKIEELYTGRCR
jgi:aspartate aminotransferase-like enzyme